MIKERGRRLPRCATSSLLCTSHSIRSFSTSFVLPFSVGDRSEDSCFFCSPFPFSLLPSTFRLRDLILTDTGLLFCLVSQLPVEKQAAPPASEPAQKPATTAAAAPSSGAKLPWPVAPALASAAASAEASEAAKATEKGKQLVEVRIPPGVVAGQEVEAQVPGHGITKFLVPAGAAPGELVTIRV